MQDSEAMVCLSCKKTFCDNCLGSKAKTLDKASECRAKIAPYLSGKMSASKVAKELGVSSKTVHNWAKRYGGMK